MSAEEAVTERILPASTDFQEHLSESKSTRIQQNTLISASTPPLAATAHPPPLFDDVHRVLTFASDRIQYQQSTASMLMTLSFVTVGLLMLLVWFGMRRGSVKRDAILLVGLNHAGKTALFYKVFFPYQYD